MPVDPRPMKAKYNFLKELTFSTSLHVHPSHRTFLTTNTAKFQISCYREVSWAAVMQYGPSLETIISVLTAR